MDSFFAAAPSYGKKTPGNLDDFVKSPDAVLRFILPFDRSASSRLRAGLLPVMVSCEPVEQSKHARLACGNMKA